MKRGAPPNSWAAAIVSTVDARIPEASEILFDVVGEGEESLLSKDSEYLLRLNFSRTAQVIEKRIVDRERINPALVEGMQAFVSARALKSYPERYDQYVRVVKLLSKCFDDGGAGVKLIIAHHIASELSQAGVEYLDAFFSLDDAIGIELLDLGVRIIREGEPEVRLEFARLAIGAKGAIRDRILSVFRTDCIDAVSFEQWIYELCSNVSIYGGLFDELSSFRTDGRYNQWDRAVLRSIAAGSSVEVLVRNCIALWKMADQATHSSPLKDFLILLDRGHNPQHAAVISVHYTEDARRRLLRGAGA